MNSLKHYPLLLIVLLISTSCFSQERTNPKNHPEELGMVSWYRDYDVAIEQSKNTGKPILILFQEVPGCSTCKNYGEEVLSNPLMTDAIENEFVPLAIYNNKGGKDREILQKYTESAWNNPVVNIVNDKGEKMVNRVAGNYTVKGLYTAMVEALNIYKKPLPIYFKLLGEELQISSISKKEKYYSMYCFWTGEKELGSQLGVLNTEAGFMKGHEVVKVTYNSTIVEESELDKFATAKNMKSIKNDKSYHASSKDEDYYLQHSDYKYLPLSELQRTKINSALGEKQDASQFLSPKQKNWMNSFKTNNNNKRTLYNKGFESSWKTLALK